MTNGKSTSTLTVACHVRSSRLLGTIDRNVERLRACEDEGLIDALLVRSWPKEIQLNESTPCSALVEHFEQFESWAGQCGVSVRPPFRTRTAGPMTGDTEREVLVTPAVCLAVYRDDGLVGVFPHSDGEETYTVAEAIDDLESGMLPGPVEGSLESTASQGSGASDTVEQTCPACDGSLVNVQGMLACRDCSWSEAALEAIASSEGKLVYLSLSSEPRSVDVLNAALDLNKSTLYSILSTLADRGLVERVDRETYRACTPESDRRREQAVAAREE